MAQDLVILNAKGGERMVTLHSTKLITNQLG